MMNSHTLFNSVQDYYQDLIDQIKTAREMISMNYLAFEDGTWARKIGEVLGERAAAGVKVRLMVDDLGQLSDEPRRILHNHAILDNLREHGIHVDIFRPSAPRLSIRNRLHAKFCAIDDHTAYLGGSNIGDYYVQWSDTNLRVDGPLGDTFHRTYDYLLSFTNGGSAGNPPEWAGEDQLHLTIPGRCQDIRESLLRLILNADRAVYLRSWYFLPEDEIMRALCAQARKGVDVNVLLSHRTRVRPVDFANHIHISRLASAGGHVYRYLGRYMHSKVAWNNRDEVLLGSANLDAHSMRVNFEICLQIHDQALTWGLQRAFQADLHASLPQTPQSFAEQSLPSKMLSRACNLAADWL